MLISDIIYEQDQEITQAQLDALESVLDRVFAQLGIDVEFTRHFLDRVNDERNRRQITIKELGLLFKKEFIKYGKPIAQLGPGAEAVMKDMETNINLPFALRWDANNNELDLIAKTIMRKPDFKTSNKTFTVERAKNESINEAFDNPYPFKLTGPDESQSFVATAQTPNGVLRMDFETTDYDNFGIDFAVGKSMGKTEAGDEFRVFATVVAMMNKWISTVGIKHVESFDFGANKGEHASDGRAKLYTRFAKKLASQLGWKLEQSTTQDRSTAFFKLTNPKPVPREQEYWDALEENFKHNENVEEGYKLQLERDTDMMVLHIKDTVTGKRTEVRGKSGYESGNYDANDKLHRLLDKLGKSVDISQLMNGESVGINPKHPQGASAKKHADIAFNENFADGKVKGKSRPGRVKRSGASCKGSVTDLRAKAKKYSGERAKMYHWCANMKAGKKK